jgi:CHAP domain-containing protein
MTRNRSRPRRRARIVTGILSLAVAVAVAGPAAASARPASAPAMKAATAAAGPGGRPLAEDRSDGSHDYPYAAAVSCSKKYGPRSWCINGRDTSPLGFKYRNDTDYVAWKIDHVFGVRLPSKLGSASTWAARLKADHFTVDKQPRVGDILVWNAPDGGSGHVGYVYAVSNGVASLDEYDADGTGKFSDDRTTAEIPSGSTTTSYSPQSTPPCTGNGGTQLPPSVAVNPATGLGVAAAVGPSNSLYVYWQNASGLWQGPLGLDGGAPGIAYSSPSIAVNPLTGLPMVAAEGPSNSLYVYWENANAQWSGPLGIDHGDPNIAFSQPSLAVSPTTGLAVILAVGPSNTLYTYWQNSTGGWLGPGGLDHQSAGIAYSAPSMVMNPSTGLPDASALGPSDSLHAYWQNANAWWQGPLGIDNGRAGIGYSAPSEALNPQTLLPTVLAEGPQHSLYVYWQQSNGQWTGPLGVGNGSANIAYSQPSFGFDNVTGLPVALAVGRSNSLYTYWQQSNGQWVGPAALDNSATGLAYSAPSLAVNPRTGLPFALAVGPSNSLYAYWQNASGKWSGPLGVDNGIGCIAY